MFGASKLLTTFSVVVANIAETIADIVRLPEQEAEKE